MFQPMGYPVVNADDLPVPEYNPTRWTHVLGAVIAVVLFAAYVTFLVWQVDASVDDAFEGSYPEISVTEVPDVAVCTTSEGICHPRLGGRPLDTQQSP